MLTNGSLSSSPDMSFLPVVGNLTWEKQILKTHHINFNFTPKKIYKIKSKGISHMYQQWFFILNCWDQFVYIKSKRMWTNT